MRFSTLLTLISLTMLTGCETPYQAFHYGQYWTAEHGLQEKAQQGDAEAETDLGYMYQYGLAIKPDDTKAMQLFQQAAAQHYAPAITCEAVLYITSYAIPHDYAEAKRLLEPLAASGDIRAKEDLAELYSSGIGVDPDPSKAMQIAPQSLWDSDQEWIRYVAQIRSAVDVRKYYPTAAVQKTTAGIVLVGFQMHGDTPINIHVVKSSGSEDLDQGFLNDIQRSSFPLPPMGLLTVTQFEIAMNYSIGGHS